MRLTLPQSCSSFMGASGPGATPNRRGRARRVPAAPGRRLPLRGRPTGDRHAGPRCLPPGYFQEVGGGDVVVEDDQDGGPDPVVVGGPVRRVVAQVGGEALRHG